MANFITLEEVASSLSSNLNTKYSGLNVTSSDDGLNITYGDIKYSVPFSNSELAFTIDEDNVELSKDIYENIISSICVYYHNDLDGCKNASAGINSSNISGVRFIDNVVYINTINSVSPISNTNIMNYTEETILDINDYNYTLSLNSMIISNINITTNNNLTFSGDITYSDNSKSSSKVTVRLYDINGTLITESSNDATNNFSISFENSDNLKIEDVKKYSIVIE